MLLEMMEVGHDGGSGDHEDDDDDFAIINNIGSSTGTAVITCSSSANSDVAPCSHASNMSCRGWGEC